MKTWLSESDIHATIDSEQYHHFPGTSMTVCCLTLKNGYAVIGKSSSVDPARFNEEIGKKAARDHAVDNIWELEGYLLKDQLAALLELKKD